MYIRKLLASDCGRRRKVRARTFATFSLINFVVITPRHWDCWDTLGHVDKNSRSLALSRNRAPLTRAYLSARSIHFLSSHAGNVFWRMYRFLFTSTEMYNCIRLFSTRFAAFPQKELLPHGNNEVSAICDLNMFWRPTLKMNRNTCIIVNSWILSKYIY